MALCQIHQNFQVYLVDLDSQISIDSFLRLLWCADCNLPIQTSRAGRLCFDRECCLATNKHVYKGTGSICELYKQGHVMLFIQKRREAKASSRTPKSGAFGIQTPSECRVAVWVGRLSMRTRSLSNVNGTPKTMADTRTPLGPPSNVRSVDFNKGFTHEANSLCQSCPNDTHVTFHQRSNVQVTSSSSPSSETLQVGSQAKSSIRTDYTPCATPPRHLRGLLASLQLDGLCLRLRRHQRTALAAWMRERVRSTVLEKHKRKTRM